LLTSANDNINPATTPRVDPIAAPPTNASTSTIYREKTCSMDASKRTQPMVPVKIEEIRMIIQMISSFFNVGLYLPWARIGTLCIKIRTKTAPMIPSTDTRIRSEGDNVPLKEWKNIRGILVERKTSDGIIHCFCFMDLYSPAKKVNTIMEMIINNP